MTAKTDELVMIEGATPAPVTVPEGDDPWPVLRAMQKFMPGTSHGECEIVDPRRQDGVDVYQPIGLTTLIGRPEQVMQPVFDCRTRVVEVVELAAWLKGRGYEPSACQWNRPSGFRLGNAAMTKPEQRWQLITGKAELPPLPAMAAPPTAGEILLAAGCQPAEPYRAANALLNALYPMPRKGR